MMGEMSIQEIESAINDIIGYESDEYGVGAEHQLALFVLAYARGGGPQWLTRFLERKKRRRGKAFKILSAIEQHFSADRANQASSHSPQP